MELDGKEIYGTPEMGHRTALYALIFLAWHMMSCDLIDSCHSCGAGEAVAAAALLLEAGAPLHAEADQVAESGSGSRRTTSGVIRRCRQLEETADGFLASGYGSFGAQLCRSIVAKLPAAER